MRDDLRAQQQRYIERLVERQTGKVKSESGEDSPDDKALLEV